MSTGHETEGSASDGVERTLSIATDGTTLPVVEILTGRGFITGKSGAGKSNSASVIAEELLEQRFPLLIIDVDGEYYGLKEEFEMLHVGADSECDLQVGEEHAEKIAELALDENVPIVLDVSGYLDDDVARDLIRGVTQRLFALEKKRKRPFLLLIEEIHEYIPEGGGLDECGRMLIKAAKRGRKHGLGLCGVSQRPADVKKDFITQCDWLVWHRLTWDNDTAVVQRVLGNDYADGVRDLTDGEAYLMTDWNGGVRQVQFRRKSTFDAGATPGLDDVERPSLKSVSGGIVSELEEITERQRQRRDEVAQLRSQLERKEETIENLEAELEQAQGVTKLADRFTEALAHVDATANDANEIEATLAELREEKNEEIRGLASTNESLRTENEQLQGHVTSLEEQLEASDRAERLERHFDEATEAYERLGEALGIGTDHGSAERLRDQVETLESKLEAARQDTESAATEGTDASEELTTYREFISDDRVQSAIRAAKEEASSPRYVDGTLECIIETGEPVSYATIADHLDISTTSHIATAVNALASENVISKSRDNGRTQVDLAINDLANIRQRARRRDEAAELLG